MGNLFGKNWGIVFNQSKTDIKYILHCTSKLKQENKEGTKKGIQRTLEPGRISMLGLKDVDFDKIKYITIVDKQGKTVMSQLKVVDYSSLRLKVRDDLSIKQMSQSESSKLEEFADGHLTQKGDCISCENKADNMAHEKQIECRQCKEEFKNLWVCKFLPQKHAYCDSCYTVGLLQKRQGRKKLERKVSSIIEDEEAKEKAKMNP